MIEIRHYVSRAGKDVFDDWLSQLADARAQAKIASRIHRPAAGNFGDSKPLRQGVCVLRIDWGPGCRVYYAMLGRVCVLLLCGGDKRKQSSDIHRALEYLRDYKDWRLEAVATGCVRAADRLGTGLSGLLRDAWEGMCLASLRRRQTKTVARH